MKISTLLIGLSLAASGPAEARARWAPTAHGLVCVSMAASEPDVLLCELGDRFQIHPDALLAMPQILAGGFSSSSSLIGTTGEGNGFIFDSATAPAATNAYVNYDGTNVGVNAPTGKGVAFGVAGTNYVAVSNLGIVLSVNGTGIGANSPNNTLDLYGGSGAVTQEIRFFESNKSSIDMRTGQTGSDFTDMSGQVNVSHLAGGSPAPTSPTAGTGCGTSSLPTLTGSDLSGTIGVTCGATGTASATIVSATFGRAYSVSPNCTVDAGNAAALNLAAAQKPGAFSTTATTLTITASSTTLVAGTYLWKYTCTQ